jgi:phage FluMu protein Com
MKRRYPGERPLAAVENVRCLECDDVYAKPAGGGTARANPGCPRCGYVGWMSIAAPISVDLEPSRFDGDLLPRHSVQSG